MNHTWSRIRRNTIGVAVAVTCASGLPLAGCLKSSSRSFSTGLGGNAGRAAIEAERDIEEQKRQDALIAKQETSSDTNARILGPHERNIGTAAQSEDIGFASTAQVARKPESDAGNSGIQQVTGTETSQTENTVWESLVQEHLAQRPPEKKTQSEFENPFANWGTPPTNEPRSGVASPSQWPEDPWAEPQSRNLAFSSEVASDDLSAPTPEWARETQHVTSRQTDGKRSESRTIQPKRSVERLRVQALLSDAHSQKIRGELHSAYRSALLAERIAQQNGMEFPTEEEEDPAEFARELANQIWKSSEEPAPTKSEHQVTIQPRQPEHDHVFAEYDAFAQWRKAPVQANTPRDLNRSEPDPDRVVSDKSVVPEENEHFPLIRPQAEVRNTSVLNEGSTGDVPQIIPSRTSKAATQEPTSHASLQSPPILEDQARQASRTEPSSPPQWASADAGVQFAIAHEKSVVSDVVIPNESSGSSLPEWAAQPAAFPVDVSGLIEPRRLESESAKETKPVLMAPSFEPQAIEPDPEPIAPVAFQVPSEGSPTWQELTSELAPQFEEAPADVPQLTPGSELKWGVIGFISAVLTTLIGVSLSRRQNSPPREPGNPESAAPSESTQSDEEDNFLQMKRVA